MTTKQRAIAMRIQLSVAVLIVFCPTIRAADEELAKKAYAVLATHCYPCHGQNGSKSKGIDYILKAEVLKKNNIVSPHKPEESLLVRRMKDKDDPMPPLEVTQRLAKEEIATVEAWIKEGANELIGGADQQPARKSVSFTDTISIVHGFLKQLRPEERSRYRFITLAPQHNTAKVGPDTLRTYRAAVSKLLNSLSYRDIHVPELVDANGTVFAVDLAEFGWTDRDFWTPLTEGYPYGLKHDRLPDRSGEANRLAKEVHEWTGTSIPVIRADWFVFQASRAPLYDRLLALPANVGDLERKLGVSREKNILERNVARAGFVKSGVSVSNRMVERHTAKFGSYWISYDFAKSAKEQDLIRFPLGPKFEDNPHPKDAFLFDGGEVIFTLPNGLQGYMITDSTGKRLDEAPVSIVRDSKENSGSPVVVNGVSCMACHSQGMITDFKDEVRFGNSLRDEPRAFAESLYLEDARMRKLLAKDQARFLSALDLATGSLYRTEPSDRREIRLYPEPIGLVSKAYSRGDLTLADLAAELGLADPKTLSDAIRQNAAFDKLGLKAILDANGTIKRDTWEVADGPGSRFQRVAVLLKLGDPVFPSKRIQK